MKFQVGLSWLLRALGAGSFIDRVLHVPTEALPGAAALAGVTPDQWRAVEAVQQRIVKEGINVKVPGAGL